MCSLLIIILGKKKNPKEPKDNEAILPIENQQENETAETTELIHDENKN